MELKEQPGNLSTFINLYHVDKNKKQHELAIKYLYQGFDRQHNEKIIHQLKAFVKLQFFSTFLKIYNVAIKSFFLEQDYEMTIACCNYQLDYIENHPEMRSYILQFDYYPNRLFHLLGMTHYMMGDYIKAERCFRIVLTKTQNMIECVANYISTLKKLGRFEEAANFSEDYFIFLRASILSGFGYVTVDDGEEHAQTTPYYHCYVKNIELRQEKPDQAVSFSLSS